MSNLVTAHEITNRNDLNTAQKKLISNNLITQNVKKGTIIHNGNLDCTGLLLVKSGQRTEEYRKSVILSALPAVQKKGKI